MRDMRRGFSFAPLVALLAVAGWLPFLLLAVGVWAGCSNGSSEADGGTDAGTGAGSCWRDFPDAGRCTGNSQCPGNTYCDFSVELDYFTCLIDGGLFQKLTAGNCLPRCPADTRACVTGEDCPVGRMCLGGNYNACTVASPCPGGSGSCGEQPCPQFEGCPTGLVEVQAPHYNCTSCIWPACFPDGGP
jgi:hypothetical protein